MKIGLVVMSLLIICVGVAVASISKQGLGQQQKGDISMPETIFSIPDTAIELSHGLYYLGEDVDNGKPVKGYLFVHYEKGNSKKVLEPAEAEIPALTGELCYNFVFGTPISWTGEPESYVINPKNKNGFEFDEILSVFETSILTWESVVPDYGIIGDGSKTDVRFRGTRLDGINSVRFDNLRRGVIGMNIIWTNGLELLEWDQIYSNRFDWSLDCVPDGEDCSSKMDLQNIVTHELGHAIGLGDLYNSECSAQTMYGYSNYGETTKRDLGVGDKAGVNVLYGPILNQ